MTGVLLAVLVAAGCSSPPPPVEEVIPHGQLPTEDLWCQLLSAEEVETLLGEGDLERVRQSGDYQPNPTRPLSDCNVVWADGDRPVRLVDTKMWRLSGGQVYLDSLTNLRNLLGTRGQQIDSGKITELQPGVYLDIQEPTRRHPAERGSLRVFLACESGEALPVILDASVYVRPAGSGQNLTQEQYASLGERVRDTATWVHPCDGELRPLGPEDWEPLADRAHGDA